MHNFYRNGIYGTAYMPCFDLQDEMAVESIVCDVCGMEKALNEFVSCSSTCKKCHQKALELGIWQHYFNTEYC